MKFKRLDLLTLLISLFIFASCKNSSTIGLDLDPATAIQGKLIDSVTVTTRTVADQPATSAGLTTYPFGYITDPTFGTSEASIAMSVGLPSSAAYDFGTNAVVDSAILVLPYATSGFYGDSTSTYSIDVHQLKSDITDAGAAAFKTDKSFAYNTTLSGYPDGVFGNYTGPVKPNTPFKVTAIVSGGIDTLVAVPAQIRVKLDKAFIQNNIVNLGTASLINNATFTNSFKGLHLSLNKSKSTGKGGIMYFNFSGGTSQLEVYFKRQNSTTATAVDTVLASFPISSSTAPVAATVSHNYTGTDIAKQLSTPTVQYQSTYIQGLTGVRNKISFPYLASFIKNLGGKVVINKAELVLDLSSGTDIAPFYPATALALYTTDLAGARVNILDNQAPTTSVANPNYLSNFGGGYDATNKNYTFVITSYLQNLLDGKTVDHGTYIGASSTSILPSSTTYLQPPVTSAERSVIGAFGNATNKVKLNIYYTKIN